MTIRLPPFDRTLWRTALLAFALAALAPAVWPQSADFGAAVKRSLDRSRTIYPAAADANSPLGLAVNARIVWLGKNDPSFFSNADWPWQITATEARALGIAPRMAPPPPPVAPGSPTRHLATVTRNFSVTGASFRKGQQIILETLQDYGKRGVTVVEGQPVSLWLDHVKILRPLDPGEIPPVVVKIDSARYGPAGKPGYSVAPMVQSLIWPTAAGFYEILASDALLPPAAASTQKRRQTGYQLVDPQTGQVAGTVSLNESKNVLTVKYTMQGRTRTKQAAEGETLVLD